MAPDPRILISDFKIFDKYKGGSMTPVVLLCNSLCCSSQKVKSSGYSEFSSMLNNLNNFHVKAIHALSKVVVQKSLPMTLQFVLHFVYWPFRKVPVYCVLAGSYINIAEIKMWRQFIWVLFQSMNRGFIFCISIQLEKICHFNAVSLQLMFLNIQEI